MIMMKSFFTIFLTLFVSKIHASATDWQLSFQNPATDLMKEDVTLHNGILIVMTLITLFVLFYIYLK